MEAAAERAASEPHGSAVEANYEKDDESREDKEDDRAELETAEVAAEAAEAADGVADANA